MRLMPSSADGWSPSTVLDTKIAPNLGGGIVERFDLEYWRSHRGSPHDCKHVELRCVGTQMLGCPRRGPGPVRSSNWRGGGCLIWRKRDLMTQRLPGSHGPRRLKSTQLPAHGVDLRALINRMGHKTTKMALKSCQGRFRCGVRGRTTPLARTFSLQRGTEGACSSHAPEGPSGK
jgi:hypothetical protein